MTYTAADARQQLLESVVNATNAIGQAIASLSVAYDLLDDHHAEVLEAQLFQPLQRAYGCAKRTHAMFASRHGLPAGDFKTQTQSAPSIGVKALIEAAAKEIDQAETELVALQDSLLPIEVGDPELRSGLAETRTLIGGLRQQSREFLRTFGR